MSKGTQSILCDSLFQHVTDLFILIISGHIACIPCLLSRYMISLSDWWALRWFIGFHCDKVSHFEVCDSLTLRTFTGLCNRHTNSPSRPGTSNTLTALATSWKCNCSESFVTYCILFCLGIKPKASCMLNIGSASDLTPAPTCWFNWGWA
jgi:hypothetical protein